MYGQAWTATGVIIYDWKATAEYFGGVHCKATSFL